MILRRSLLPPGLDREERAAALRRLIAEQHRAELKKLKLDRDRRRTSTVGWMIDYYPNERGWQHQPGNVDPRGRIFFAEIKTVKRRRR
jgi:hypothetical protein